MGGPYVEILLGKEISAEDRLKVKTLFESMSIRPSKREIWPAFSIVSTKLISGFYEDKGRRFGIKGKGRFFEIAWITGEAYIEKYEDFSSLCKDVFRPFALLPCAGIGLQALGNQKEDHRILGELALYLAKAFEGLVDFGGALLPPNYDAFCRNPLFFKQANWEDVREPFEQWQQTMPGRIIAIPYQTASGRTWATHIGDAEFMAAWLQHPGFHMIK
jgi:hypothetical protein